MERYIALLRGINVGGKNKIAMAELKAGCVALGCTAVSTHLNSGNVVFSSKAGDADALAGTITAMIKSKFGLDIPVFVIAQNALEELLNHAPDWWGDTDKEIYDNLIFMFPPLCYNAFLDTVGDAKDEYEKVHPYKNAIFWSFSRKDYQKTNWWPKTARSSISDRITIRTANTVRKLVGM